MNILMMSNTYLPVLGGLEKSIQSFSAQFRKWGHRVLIVIPEMEGGSDHDPHVVQLPVISQIHKDGLFLSLPLTAAVNRVMNLFQPDIIHVHHPFLIGETALRLAIRYHKPLIYTHHILFEQYSHYLPIPSDLARRFLVSLSIGFANLTKHVIAPSQSIKVILEKEGVRVPISVAPTGIDVVSFKNGKREKVRESLNISHNAFVLGYVGRLAEEKNFDFLIQSLILFLKKHRQAHFVAIGQGPLEQTIREQFAEADLQTRIHLIGSKSGDELIQDYHAFDGFIFASKSETQGLVLCEAMAAGVPVIALNGPGVREIVKDFENGRLVHQEDLYLFETAMEWLMDRSQQEYETLRRNAIRTAEDYSLERCAQKALEVYQTAIKQVSPQSLSDKRTRWRNTKDQILGEWKILANFGRATREALVGGLHKRDFLIY